MDTTLAATVRADGARGKGAARKLRAQGKIPGIVYGAIGAPCAVELDPTVLSEIFRVTGDRNTILQVQIDGAAVPCVVRDAQRHPLSRELLHVDLFAVPAEGEVTVLVPVEATGKSKGAGVGGRPRIIRRDVWVACHYTVIPKTVQVDVSGLDVEEQLRVSQVSMPAGQRIVYETDFAIVGIVGKSKKGEK